jgi:hypothetical protein
MHIKRSQRSVCVGDISVVTITAFNIQEGRGQKDEQEATRGICLVSVGEKAGTNRLA